MYSVHQHPTLSGDMESGKSQNTAKHTYAEREVMHDRVRQEENEGASERADSVKLSSAIWDQVSDLLSLLSSQR